MCPIQTQILRPKIPSWLLLSCSIQTQENKRYWNTTSGSCGIFEHHHALGQLIGNSNRAPPTKRTVITLKIVLMNLYLKYSHNLIIVYQKAWYPPLDEGCAPNIQQQSSSVCLNSTSNTILSKGKIIASAKEKKN